MENRCSNYVRILNEICQEEEISLDSYSEDWAFRLQKGEKKAFILGYQFGLNAASVQQICTDKNITSEILRQEQIPSVYHGCYIRSDLFPYTGGEGNWAPLLQLLHQEHTLVCKDNYGTGGKLVFRVDTPASLEAAAAEIYAVSQAMAVCPYEQIFKECRFIILDGEIQTAFVKLRQKVTGDGLHTVGQLIGALLQQGTTISVLPQAGECRRVPASGEEVFLNWKHNLGQGASARILTSEEQDGQARRQALRAMEALSLRFASVDMIETAEGWKVLEVNSGVMMEHLTGICPEYYQKGKEIYKKAVLAMLSDK